MPEVRSHTVTMGDRGRFVLPVEVRERHGWATGTPLVAIDTETGVLVMSVDGGLAWLRTRLAGRDLVAELLEERRADAERESS